MRNKALLFTRVEGGTMIPFPVEIYEDDLSKYYKVETKSVFQKMLNKKMNTRVVQFGKLFVHALFFEDGVVYDVHPDGFKKRPGHDNSDHYVKIYNEKTKKHEPEII